MSRAWNGDSLVNELSALLGDTSAAFQVKVLGWLNDTIFDIATRHDWGHHLTKGKKILASGEESHSLELGSPEACTVALATGGTLSENSKYSVIVTYVQANGVETPSGAASSVLTMTGATLSMSLSAIPTSLESLVTKRNVYLQKDDLGYFLHTTIDDNFTTTLTISDATSSVIEPPDYEVIRRLKGSPFFEGNPSNYLIYKDIDQLRLMAQGQWQTGTPAYFSPVESNSISTYPIPSSDLEVSFNYYRNPFKIYDSINSQPDLPIYLKPALKAGVIAIGYEYRDRAGQEIKKANYENALIDAINRGGRVANIEYSVRDVYGSFDGFEVG